MPLSVKKNYCLVKVVRWYGGHEALDFTKQRSHPRAGRWSKGKVWGRFPIGGKSSQGNYNRPRAELRLDIKDWSFSSIGLRAGFLLIQLFGVDVFCGLVVWNSKMFICFPDVGMVWYLIIPGHSDVSWVNRSLQFPPEKHRISYGCSTLYTIGKNIISIQVSIFHSFIPQQVSTNAGCGFDPNSSCCSSKMNGFDRLSTSYSNH